MSNKYGARRTFSALCGRWFDSKAECVRGEELALLEKSREIKGLQYQVRIMLCEDPKVVFIPDFSYLENGKLVYEDVKGMITREFRLKSAWAKQRYGIEVRIVK